MLPAVHHSGGVVCEPVDIPVPLERHLQMARAHLHPERQALHGRRHRARAGSLDTVEMVKLVFGADFVDRELLSSTAWSNTNAPLVLDATMLWRAQSLCPCTTRPWWSRPSSSAGAMSPVSVAGTLGQILAEVLAGTHPDPAHPAGRALAVMGTFFSPISLLSGSLHLRHPRGHAVPDVRRRVLAERLGVPFHSVGGA